MDDESATIAMNSQAVPAASVVAGAKAGTVVLAGDVETPMSPPSPQKELTPNQKPSTAVDPPTDSNATTSPPKDTESEPLPSQSANEPPAVVESPCKPKVYGASIDVGNGRFVPVGSATQGSKIDFESEKAKIEEQFSALEAQLDAGTRPREEIEAEFAALTHKADTLRRLQEAEKALNRAPMGRPKSLAPVKVTRKASIGSSTPSMAVVHWKKVSKEEHAEYKAKLLEKYGHGPELVKSVERIPNRILITAPVPSIMEAILADESLRPRPEPYVLPGKGATPIKAPPPPPLQKLASEKLSPVGTPNLAQLAGVSKLPPIQAQ